MRRKRNKPCSSARAFVASAAVGLMVLAVTACPGFSPRPLQGQEPQATATPEAPEAPRSANPVAAGSSERTAADHARIERALRLLERGRYEAARKVLKQGSDEKAVTENDSEAAFYLGIIGLLESDTVAELESSSQYFRKYVQRHPEAPHARNAGRIAEILAKFMDRDRSSQREIEVLKTQLKTQAATIGQLRYQIEKLEEIQLDTEEKRKSMELELEK